MKPLAPHPRYGTAYGLPWQSIVQIMASRRNVQTPLMRAIIDVTDRYNGDWVLPDLPGYEGLAPAIIHDSIEHNAMRANQMRASVVVPAINGAAQQGITSPANASLRKNMLLATQEASAFDLVKGRAYRQYFAYGISSMMVRPDLTEGCVRYVLRVPATTYPEPKAPEDVTPPKNSGYVYGQSAHSLRSRYAAVCQENGGPIPPPGRAHQDDLWDVLEWWDEDAMVLGILGPRYETGARTREIHPANSKSMEIYRVPNRAGVCPVAQPTVVTLDRIASAVSAVTGQTDLLARFAALDLIASEKAIFPDRYIIGSGPGVEPRLVNGKWADGRTGDVNLLTDTSAVGELRGTPDPSGKIARDYLERNSRITVGLTAPHQGETYGALRTGRGIDSLMEAAVDPRMFEAHAVMAYNEQLLNSAAIATYKGYFGKKTFSMYSRWAGDQVVEFTPDKDIPTRIVEDENGDPVRNVDGSLCECPITLNSVEYPFQGSDLDGATMRLGQLLAAEGVSKAEYRRMHPLVKDADATERQLLVERFEELALGMLEVQFSPQGGAEPIDAVPLLEFARQGKSIEEIIKEVDRLARERQATVAPEPGPDQIAAPEAMPGIGMGGLGGEQPMPAPEDTTFDPTDRQAALRRLTLALKTAPSMSA